MDTAANPRAVIGGNEAPDYAKSVTDQMRRDYAEVEATVNGLLDEARELPMSIADDEQKGAFTRLIKRLRDVTKRLEAFQAKEKEPYLRGGQAVDQFFYGLWDKVARRDRKNKPGAADILLARLNDYDTRKLAEEQARRAREAAEAERIRQEAEAEERRKAEEAEQARLAAERARAPAKVEEKAAIATQAETAADAAKVETTVAAAKAEDARIATLAKPAEIMRHRGDDGTLSTMGTEKYAEIIDAAKLDKEALWPFIKIEEKEKALRAWANTTGHTVQMAGASIGKRPKSVVR